MRKQRLSFVQALDYARGRVIDSTRGHGSEYGETVYFTDGSRLEIEAVEGTYYSTLTGSDPAEFTITLYPFTGGDR